MRRRARGFFFFWRDGWGVRLYKGVGVCPLRRILLTADTMIKRSRSDCVSEAAAHGSKFSTMNLRLAVRTPVQCLFVYVHVRPSLKMSVSVSEMAAGRTLSPCKKKIKKKIDKYKKSVLHSHQLTHKIAFEHSGEICCLSDQYQQNTAPVGYVVATKPVAGKRGMRSADSVGIKDEKPLMAVCSGSGPSCVLVSLLYVR